MRMFTIALVLSMITMSAFASGAKDEKDMDDSMMPSDSMMASDDMMESDETGMMGLIDPFHDFTDLKSAAMMADSKPTVLFFYATWCPTCKTTAEELKASPGKLDGVNLLIVDYDNSDDLQMKYGVTYQHTFVLIDSDGEALDTWNGGGIDDILMHAEMDGMKEM